MPRTIGITLGDPAGIGPEITARALASGSLPDGFAYQVIGTPPQDVTPGEPSPISARAALRSLEEGVDLAMRKEIAALVTSPVSKSHLQSVGFGFPGQTEFLASRTGSREFAMALTGGGLTVALATIHIPLREVPDRLRTTGIVRVGRLLDDFLRRRHPDSHPRIAVAGLNPHAGESGAFGDEESRIIAPAVKKLRRALPGSFLDGPFPPDTVFHEAVSGSWDAVLCMYHDQGLIPLKLHAFYEGVNTTLGLPIIRTSPDHGTAFPLAGTGKARPDSMIAAIRLACELAGVPDDE